MKLIKNCNAGKVAARGRKTTGIAGGRIKEKGGKKHRRLGKESG